MKIRSTVNEGGDQIELFVGRDLQVTFENGDVVTLVERPKPAHVNCVECGKRPQLEFFDGGTELTPQRDGKCARCFLQPEIHALWVAAQALSSKWEEATNAHNADESGIAALNEPKWLNMSLDEWAAEISGWEEDTR